MRRFLLKSLLFCSILLISSYAHAATWYVSTTGSGSGTCTDTSNYCTFARAQTVASNGDTILFNAGTYTSSHGLTWTVSKELTLKPETGETVILDGQLNITAWTSSGPALASYSGCIHVTANNVTVEGFTVQNSGGQGISVAGNYCTIKNNTITKTYRNAVYIDQADNNTVEANTCSYGGLYRLQNSTKWSGVITVIQGHYNTITKNNVSYGHGEGIDIIDGSSNNVVSYNNVHSIRMPGIYFEDGASSNIAKYNMISCPKQATGSYWYASQQVCNYGISFTDESGAYGENTANTAFGNVMTLVNRCIHFGIHTNGTTANHNNHHVYNNTCVNPQNIGIWAHSLATFSGCDVRNNIVWCNGETGACGGSKVTEISTTTGITWSNNLLYGASVDSQSAGSGDVYSAPALSKTTGWTIAAINPGVLTGEEFKLTSSSPAIDSGYNVGTGYKVVLNLDASNFLTGSWTTADQTTNGSGFEIGADVHTITSAPGAPTNLRLN